MNVVEDAEGERRAPKILIRERVINESQHAPHSLRRFFYRSHQAKLEELPGNPKEHEQKDAVDVFAKREESRKSRVLFGNQEPASEQ